jgi:hypothetical protein
MASIRTGRSASNAPRHAAGALIPHVGALRCAHPPPGNRKDVTSLVKFHWKPVAGVPFAGVGRGADRRRLRPGLPPPRHG